MSDARAQSEVVGVVLLLGVVVVVTTLVGAFVLLDSDRKERPLADLRIEATAKNVTIVHTGGDSVAVADIRVVVRSDADQQTFPVDAANVTGSDGDFGFGDTFVRNHSVAGPAVTVLVVHTPTNSVLAEADRDVVEPGG